MLSDDDRYTICYNYVEGSLSAAPAACSVGMQSIYHESVRETEGLLLLLLVADSLFFVCVFFFAHDTAKQVTQLQHKIHSLQSLAHSLTCALTLMAKITFRTKQIVSPSRPWPREDRIEALARGTCLRGREAVAVTG